MTVNSSSLDFQSDEFQKYLDKTVDLVLSQFETLENDKAYHDHSQSEIETWFDEKLPEDGMNLDEVLDKVRDRVMKTATSNLGPHMYAYVMAGGTQVSILSEMIASTINQNMGKWHLAPALSEIEKRVVQWGSEMIGFGENIGGVLVSGGSAANLAGLTVARNIKLENSDVRNKGLFAQKPATVYASNEVHGCMDKSMDLLGLGINNLRKIDTNEDFSIDLTALENQIEADIEEGFQPFCIVGNAGTVNTGAIDDLIALSELCKKYSLWYHIDGAYGGLAWALPEIADKYKGIELADSIAIDFHKWLYQPFEAGCLMVKDWDTLRRAYFKKADYLDTSLEAAGRLDFNEHYFQLSRNAKSLKIWMSVKAYGMSRIRDMIQKDVDLTRYLGDQVKESDDFEIMSEPMLGITCFRYVGDLQSKEEIVKLNQELIPALEKDGRVFITGTKLNGEFAIRACLINHRKTTETTDFLLDVIREVASSLTGA